MSGGEKRKGDGETKSGGGRGWWKQGLHTSISVAYRTQRWGKRLLKICACLEQGWVGEEEMSEKVSYYFMVIILYLDITCSLYNGIIVLMFIIPHYLITNLVHQKFHLYYFCHIM